MMGVNKCIQYNKSLKFTNILICWCTQHLALLCELNSAVEKLILNEFMVMIMMIMALFFVFRGNVYVV